MNRTLAIHEHDIVYSAARRSFCYRSACSTGTGNHHLQFDELFITFAAFVSPASTTIAGAVLIVVHHRNIEFVHKTLFDLKASGWTDMSSRLMPPNPGAMAFTSTDDLFSVSCVSSTMGQASMPAISSKGKRLPFHHRQSPEGTDVSETKHSRAV